MSEVSPAIATIIGATVGAAAAVLGGWLSTRAQLRLERLRWPKAREDAIAADYRETVRKLTTAIASALHSICWLTWLAREDPDRLTAARIETYDSEIHKILPEITGHLAAVAALDSSTYPRMRAICEQLYKIDYRIGRSSILLSTDPAQAHELLKVCWGEATEMDKQLPDQIANIVGATLERRALLVERDAK